MKKTILITILAGTLVVSLGLAGFAYAQAPTPATPANGLFRRGGPGMGNLGSGYGLAAGPFNPGEGPLHDLINAQLAEALGLEPEAFTARIAGGETFVQIALDLGYEWAEARELMAQAHEQALEQALADDLITQEQFDWMSSRGAALQGRGPAAGARGIHSMEGPLHDLVTTELAEALGLERRLSLPASPAAKPSSRSPWTRAMNGLRHAS